MLEGPKERDTDQREKEINRCHKVMPRPSGGREMRTMRDRRPLVCRDRGGRSCCIRHGLARTKNSTSGGSPLACTGGQLINVVRKPLIHSRCSCCCHSWWLCISL